jgi:hypothetical protein
MSAFRFLGGGGIDSSKAAIDDSICINDQPATACNIESLTEMLCQSVNKITKLDLSGLHTHQSLGDESMKVFVGAIPSSLCSIRLSNSQILQKGIHFLQPFLKTDLTHLDVSANVLQAAGIATLSTLLSNNAAGCTLVSLNIAGNWIDDCSSLTSLMAAPSNALQSLATLDISGNSLEKPDIASLAAAALTSSLTHVTLEEDKPISVAQFTDTTITALDLSGQGLGDASAHFVGGLLRQNQTLTSLCLDRNELNASGAISIAEGIARAGRAGVLGGLAGVVGAKGAKCAEGHRANCAGSAGSVVRAIGHGKARDDRSPSTSPSTLCRLSLAHNCLGPTFKSASMYKKELSNTGEMMRVHSAQTL